MKVEVYGGDHSPWVQAVLLTLHEKKIEHSERQLPPFEAFKQWGVMQPAVSIDGKSWEIESSEIVVRLGLDPISKKDLRAIQGAWRGVIHRSDNLFRFIAGFAVLGDSSRSFVKRSGRNFLRSFIALYMLVLLSFVKRTQKLKDPEDFGDQFLVWERTLESSAGPYLDGEAPGIRDMLLFGVIQCHSSIPVPPLQALRRDERLAGLRRWIGRMQERFNDYPHIYSGRYFEPYLPQPAAASPLQQVIFYLGLLTMIMAFPVTIPLVFVLMKKVPR
jgi:glutathione S-transferase